MAYEDRYGSTKIVTGERDNLSVSMDSGTFRTKEGEVAAVFLYTPDMNNTKEHFHIELLKDEAQKLHEWLGKFLAEKDPHQRFESDLKAI